MQNEALADARIRLAVNYPAILFSSTPPTQHRYVCHATALNHAAVRLHTHASINIYPGRAWPLIARTTRGADRRASRARLEASLTRARARPRRVNFHVCFPLSRRRRVTDRSRVPTRVSRGRVSALARVQEIEKIEKIEGGNKDARGGNVGQDRAGANSISRKR